MSIYPISFWAVIGVLLAGAAWSIQRIKDGTGIPMLAVLGTVATWYVGDAFYNDYAHSYMVIFDPGVLQDAWWQVALFVARHLHYQSGVLQLARQGISQPALQKQLNILFGGCVAIYAVLVVIAAIRIKGEIVYFFFPYLAYKPEPWGRERIGSGISALLSFAEYIQMMVATVFGVLAAVSTNRRTRILSLILCFLSWPYFLFDRTRNTILAVVIPAMLSWAFLRIRGSLWKKIAVLACLFIVVNGWMAFIIQNRSEATITGALREKGFNLKEESEVHHQGLNMFEELCWITTLINNGTYMPNWGEEYFAELVNPVPRVLWHNKPLIGIDYAKARGLGMGGNTSGNEEAGVYATVSTGLIGQGVVNFGGIVGPAVAALLMSFWVAVLARQDLHIFKLGRLPLYALGLILTFNLGRDITFITIYPFVFGIAVLWWLNRRSLSGQSNAQATTGQNELSAGSAGHSPGQRPNPRGGRRFLQPHQVQIKRRKTVTRSFPPPSPGVPSGGAKDVPRPD